jgi:hypothetical protein
MCFRYMHITLRDSIFTVLPRIKIINVFLVLYKQTSLNFDNFEISITYDINIHNMEKFIFTMT